ncbi:proton-coupled folate transporter-like [Culicoides brevitarsis]|uniref:proton-coupled folate transporter-like n=1 Tax=Culicoides brevitarsis TaxID=469753 RepID=UPI00307B6DC6
METKQNLQKLEKYQEAEQQPIVVPVVQDDSCCSKVMRVIRNISVEPTMFLYMMAFMLTNVVEQVFFVYKACRVDHGYDEDICRNIEKFENIKKEVQKTVSLFHQWDSIAGHIIPIFLALFLGAWSDKRGRKLPLIMGLTGKLVYSLMIVINAYQPNWPLNYVIYTATIPSALLGADVAIFASCFAYIADITTVQNRTLRITILDAAYLLTMPTGVAIGKELYNNVFDKSFGAMFACNVSLMLLSIIYSLVFLKWQTTESQRPISEIGYLNIFADFFDKNHAIRSFKTVLKKRPEKRRMYILMILVAMGFYTFQRDERNMLYLYTQLKLDWNTDVFSNFRTYQSSAYVVMMMVGIPIMTKVFKWSDCVLIMAGSISHAAGRVFFAFATSGWMMYVGATVACLGPVTAPVVRSFMSKLVSSAERGTLFAVLAVFDNAVPFISATLYSQLYNATINDYPASIFWLTFASQVIVFSIFLTIQISLRGRTLTQPQVEDNTRAAITDGGEGSSVGSESPRIIEEVKVKL